MVIGREQENKMLTRYLHYRCENSYPEHVVGKAGFLIDKDCGWLGASPEVKSNHPNNVKRGGVGLYVKDSFPARNRLDLATLPECIVCEGQLDKKNYCFAILYRSPSQSHIEFQDFTNNFELMLSKMSGENPYCVIITGDFNCCSTNWWEDDIKNEEDKLFEPFTSDLGLHQLINEPSHFIGNSRSCIDVIFTDQPNLFLETGVHPSLHENCHHQIVHGKVNGRSLSPPPYRCRI